MDREVVLKDQHVVIEDGIIVTVGPAADTRLPEGARRLDGSGRFLLPGLIDSHVHLRYLADGGANPAFFRLFLRHGVTTIVNLLGLPEHVRLREDIASGRVTAPQLFTSGFFVNPPYVKDAAQVTKAVRETLAGGFDFVKVHGDMPLEWYDALYSTASEVGLPVVAHAPRELGMEVAFKGRVAAIAHIEEFMYAYFTPARSARIPDGGLSTYLESIGDATKAAGASVMTSLTPFARIPTLATSPEQLVKQDGAGMLSDGVREEWARESARFKAGWTAHSEQAFGDQYRLQERLAKVFNERGVRLLAGSDAPVNGTVPGFALHEELERLVKAGLTPFEALRTATAHPAAFLGIEAGTVAAGRRADLLLLDGNPLDSIRHTRSIRTVILRGRVLPND
jgi:imidazolonepropionase-like amidohydrolase